MFSRDDYLECPIIHSITTFLLYDFLHLDCWLLFFICIFIPYQISGLRKVNTDKEPSANIPNHVLHRVP
mgnify:CR=1 FL=1